MTTATLIVTIDTEEEGRWTGSYRAGGNTVENIRYLPRFQALCDEFAIQPTYLIDAPVVDDDSSAELLRGIQEDNRCEVGTHIHPWCNPPFEEEINRRTTYFCNLPVSLQRAKLTWLTERIERRIGRRPTSFRAGRYGLDIAGARLLAELGYLVDSSVIPFTNYAPQDGPDFSQAPHTPYFINGADLCVPHAAGILLEAPVSIGYSRSDFERMHAWREAAARSWMGRLHAVGVLERLGLARRIKFSPEQTNARDLICLADNYLVRQAPALVLMFHSSSLMPGGSPYVPTSGDLDRFLDRLREIFHHCLVARGMVSATLSHFALSIAPGNTQEHVNEPSPSDAAAAGSAGSPHG